MRLSPYELESIKSSFLNNFGENDHLWLFGSRVDDSKRGGDIDLCIELAEEDSTKAFYAKLNFLYELTEKIGDQKIDVVLRLPGSNLLIHQIVRKTGIQLC